MGEHIRRSGYRPDSSSRVFSWCRCTESLLLRLARSTSLVLAFMKIRYILFRVPQSLCPPLKFERFEFILQIAIPVAVAEQLLYPIHGTGTQADAGQRGV